MLITSACTVREMCALTVRIIIRCTESFS